MGEEEAEEWQAPRPESSSPGEAEAAGLKGRCLTRLRRDGLGHPACQMSGDLGACRTLEASILELGPLKLPPP